MREVNALKQTFAKHDLDNLALAKPKMIETRVNRASKRVFDDLVKITNPTQFDETDEETSNTDQLLPVGKWMFVDETGSQAYRSG